MAQGDYDFMKEFVSSQKHKVKKCLEPTSKCKNHSIRAHSVQNSRTLDLIQDNNKVWKIGTKLTKAGPEIELQLVGRNQASTFTGFCSEHDAQIFKPIDDHKLDTSNPEHLFLLAYRSVTREYHTLLEGAIRLQKMLQKAVDDGRVYPDEKSRPMEAATGALLKAYSFFRYRFNNFDVPYLNGNFSTLQSDVILYDNQRPTIAASAFYSRLPLIKEPFTGIILNIIPQADDKMAIVFSYSSKDEKAARRSLDRLLKAAGAFQKYEVSRVLIAHTENFFLNPKFVSQWSSAKKEAILGAFQMTIDAPPEIGDNENYMMFQ